MAGTLLPIRLGPGLCGDLEAAERREWWLANGRGAYAGGTVAQTLTRRYHGLLIAPLDPPLGRVLVLAKADATATIAGTAYPLFANRWASGAVAPDGYHRIEDFALDGTVPVWRYRCGERSVEHRIWLEPGADTVHLAWRLDGAGPAGSLSVALLANGRGHHGDTRPDLFNPAIAADGARLTVAIPGRFTLTIAGSGGAIAARRQWYRDFDLPVERARGLDDRDAHLHVGDAVVPLEPGRWAGFAAGIGPDVAADLDAALARRRGHDRAAVERASAADPVFAAAPDWVRRLALAADAYVVARPVAGAPDGKSVIAGYPWFGDWGRDTMIALPGLCLATGRADAARAILETFARFVDRGMLPNVFPEGPAVPAYNTADATLWYVEAWRAYVTASGDDSALRRVFSGLAGIIDWHRRGTCYGIGVDPADGLLRAGVPGMQLTWMDARVGDRVVTPRIGKPVEINALWYNALCAMAELAGRIGADAAPYRDMAERAQTGFARFVRPDRAGLYDVLDGPDGADASLRPNQVFAVSLKATPLDPALRRAVLESCLPLVTQYGLRSLAPGSPDYRGAYRGGAAERDGAYHQGTVWAWLLGPWTLAQYRATGDAAAAQRCLDGVGPHLAEAGLGQVSEIFDGDAPHMPRGCPAQAWSVGCVLEAWWRLEHARLGTGSPNAAPGPDAATATARSARHRRRGPSRS